MLCNRFIHSAAGTGKTTKIVLLATKLAVRYHKRVVITTYTQENTIEIYNKVMNRIGYSPSNLYISTWYTFLLNDFVRPYQRNHFGDFFLDGAEHPVRQSCQLFCIFPFQCHWIPIFPFGNYLSHSLPLLCRTASSDLSMM